MFGVGTQELVILLVIVLLFFGPLSIIVLMIFGFMNLPKLAHSLGRAMRGFKADISGSKCELQDATKDKADPKAAKTEKMD